MTPEQNKAATSLWQNDVRAIQLVAGAGSGKTTTLIETVRIGIESGFDPENICLITFTRKAAREMKTRMEARNIRTGFTGTMHSLGYRIILDHFRRQEKHAPGLLLNSRAMLESVVRQVLPGYSHIPVRMLLQKKFLPPEDSRRLESAYQELKVQNNKMDLDDLIKLSCRILRDNPACFPFRYILVDEFQDTSPDQLEFIQAMNPEKLLAVGDDWQSIYSFRGADSQVSLNFNSSFPGARRLFLTHNFRSQKRIVSLGNRTIRLSSAYIPKKLKASHGSLGRPVCLIGNTADGICAIMQKSLASEYYRHLKEDLTILVRTNYIKNELRKVVPPGMEVLTIHSSKGMEFEHVLVFGIARHVFPHRWNSLDEEIRLLYVAITRAKKSIGFVSWEENDDYSGFMPFLARNCRLRYLPSGKQGSGMFEG